MNASESAGRAGQSVEYPMWAPHAFRKKPRSGGHGLAANAVEVMDIPALTARRASLDCTLTLLVLAQYFTSCDGNRAVKQRNLKGRARERERKGRPRRTIREYQGGARSAKARSGARGLGLWKCGYIRSTQPGEPASLTLSHSLSRPILQLYEASKCPDA